MKIVIWMMNKVLPTCKEVSHLTSQALDESLIWRKRLGLRLHLLVCVWCRRNHEQLQLIHDLARRQPASVSEQAKLSAEARERMAKFLDSNDDRS